MKIELKTILMTAALLLQGGVAVAQSETDSTITVGPDVIDGIPVDTLVKLSPEEQQKNAEDAMKKFAERLKAIKEAHKKKSDSQQPTDDSQQSEADTLGLPTGRLLTSKIHLLVRTYGDRVALRWVPEDYVSWLFLIDGGVNVLRQKEGEMKVDTLAYALKPWTEEQFRQKYNVNDSNAMVAMGVLYGEGRKTEGQTEEKPGSVGANVELNGEQDISFGFAMMVAEWRPDLAEALAVGLIDRNVKRGETYDYYVQPTVFDNGGKILFEPGVREGVKNEPYKPEDYNPELQDTLVSPRRVIISWVDTQHSSFEIDRRPKGEKKWERLNTKPYVTMVETDFKGLSLLSDSVPYNGLWEYRVMGHDPFGELSEPSPVHVANIYDIEPPVPPQLKYIVMEHPDTILNKKVLAHIVWENPAPEVQFDDVTGYAIKYYNENVFGKQWVVITDEMIPVTDTVYTADVTQLKTGMLCVTAYDQAGNEASSLPQLIRITDYKAPDPPDSLHYMVMPDGYVILTWEPNPIDDDITYFDVAFANDLTHEFMKLNDEGIMECGYVDSLALDVNQKYVYYRVRGVDYSGNVGKWSDYVRVTRPHVTPPSEPHLANSSHDDLKGMHMEWVVGTDADMEYHKLYRRLGDDGQWEVIGSYNADSIIRTGNYTITVDDNPPYDRRNRYYYFMESANSSPYTSSSLAVSWLHRGPKVYEVKIDLAGDYLKSSNQVKLAWTVEKLPFDAPYYYCVYRKRAGQDGFVYQMSVQPEDPTYLDGQLDNEEEAEYYLMIQWKDGRQSTPSNTIKVKKNKN
ncbi:MAG: fibronectin type III domain-containing protein [Prevotella sp.]|nr:fibronectin type III domain-containing protein [Prevotella sp.]